MKEQTLGDILVNFAKSDFDQRVEALRKHPKAGHRCDDCNHWYEADLIFEYERMLLCPGCIKKREDSND